MHKVRWALAAVAVTGGGFAWASVGAASTDEPPDSEMSGEEYLASLPDRIGVTARDSLEHVGTISREEYLEWRLGDDTPPGRQPPTPAPLEVLDDAGRLVGHYHLGVGYVSLEESSKRGFDPATIPTSTMVVSER